jgi:16S rRNA (guanine1516-N2)-methyltransferase
LSGVYGRSPLAVTTSGKFDERVISRARDSARAWDLPFLERRRKAPLRPLLERVDSLLVFEADGVALCDKGGRLRYSPGMARLRIKRLEAQVREDRLVELAGFRAGDSVLDCTLGLAGDALVAARAVGPSGRVVGLEKSLALFALVASGLPAFEGPGSCRIDVRHQDAADFLARQPDKAFDLVLFDPMFDRPQRCSPAFEMLRRHAEHAPLSASVLEDAQRVARRGVLVKGSRLSMEWRRLELKPERGSRYSPTSWARLPAR